VFDCLLPGTDKRVVDLITDAPLQRLGPVEELIVGREIS
jgi:hypothetical protein